MIYEVSIINEIYDFKKVKKYLEDDKQESE